MITCDVAIVGAGPYGLSAAAHLKAANGLDVHVFGEPMSFWERHMPKWMLLRSPLAGSHLSDPRKALTLQAFQAASGNAITAPLPLCRFIDYGRWFQCQAVPNADPRRSVRVEKNGVGRLAPRSRSRGGNPGSCSFRALALASKMVSYIQAGRSIVVRTSGRRASRAQPPCGEA